MEELEMRSDACLKVFDTNNDGRLDLQEFIAFSKLLFEELASLP